jgi:hypothetical protein
MPPTNVSAIVPARNEELTIAAAVESLAAQPEIKEIIVIDDQSTDATAAILQRLSTNYPRLRILETQVLPSGWVGKNYALSLGAALATGDWFLFTDADCVHLPSSTARALHDAAVSGAALISYSPEQETKMWWESILIPFIFTRLAQKFSYEDVNDPASPAAAANGQYLLIRREAYIQIGGHAAVAGEVLEDVAMARIAKQEGIHLHFASGEGIVRVRMYRTFGAMWQGWTKNLYPLICGPEPPPPNDPLPEPVAGAPHKMRPGKSPTSGRELIGVVPWIPLLLLLLTPLHLIFGALGAVLLAGRHAGYAAMLRRNRFPMAFALYYLPAVVLYAAVLLTSEWLYARGRVTWRGREYAVGRDS